MKEVSCLATPPNLPLRYTNNVYHQAEMVMPMVAWALSMPRRVEHIHWTVEPLAWSRSLLELIGAPIVVGNRTDATAQCRTFGRKPPGSYFRNELEAILVRRGVHKACALDRQRKRPKGAPLRVLYMPRTGAALQSGSFRNFADDAALVSVLRRALPAARLTTTPTPGSADCSRCAPRAARLRTRGRSCRSAPRRLTF